VPLIPDAYRDLLDRPLIGHLATVSPAGRPQSNPMWFSWDGDALRFTHTSTRRKYAQLQANPNVSMSVVDPDNGYRYLEVRGRMTAIEPDPTGAFYATLSARYGRGGEPPPDAADRVILVVTPLHSTQRG
jgi:PPOX class probable F420-dependent enzyme